MTVSEEQIENLKRKILKAFADVPYLKGKIAPHECDECRDVRRAFNGKNWKTISPEIIEENHGNLPLLSPSAFRYFLPAYLIFSLDNFSDADDTVGEFTIYALTPGRERMMEALDYFQEKFGEFTTDEMNCVYEFLDLVGEDDNHASFANEVKKGKQNLKKFIEPVLRK